MNILYISSACGKDKIDKYNKFLNTKLNYAHVKFHNLIIDGLKLNDNFVTYLIGLPVSRKEKLIWKKDVVVDSKSKYYQCGFINLPIIKQVCISFNMILQVKKWLKNNNDGLVILDMTYASVLTSIMHLFKNFKGKIIGIAPDVYEYMADVKQITPQNKFISKIMKSKLRKCYLKMNGYIFLTKDMSSILNPTNKPYLVMEGLVDNQSTKINDYNSKEKIILYAGGLSKRFGIEDLVNAFIQIKDKDLRLYLYGSGELETFIKNKSKKDKRIKYFGSRPNKEIVEMEKKSYLLVNPRKIEEYTKFSFPSKIMEYMLSGTVILTTKLPGIPREYDKHLFYIKDLKQDILKILKMETRELSTVAEEAYKYVVNEKNNIVQAKRIIEFGDKI